MFLPVEDQSIQKFKVLNQKERQFRAHNSNIDFV